MVTGNSATRIARLIRATLWTSALVGLGVFASAQPPLNTVHRGQAATSSPPQSVLHGSVSNDKKVHYRPGVDGAAIKRMERIKDQAFSEAESGMASLEHGDVKRAKALFRRALALYESSGTLAYVGLARIYTAQGDLVGAANAYRTLMYPRPGKFWIASTASDPVNLMSFALVLDQLGERHEAAAAYRKAFENSKGSTDVAQYLYVMPADGQYDRSRMLASAHMLLSYRYNWIKYYGESYGGYDRNEQRQIDEAREAVRYTPDDPSVHLILGIALLDHARHLRAREAPEAMAELQKAAATGSSAVVRAARAALR